MPWGGAPKCPACLRFVYPMDQCIAADRKPFHARCIHCQMHGCTNELTARTVHRYEDHIICDKCHDNIYANKTYGPQPGQESLEERRRREEEERRLREKAELAKRERKCPECSLKTFPDDSVELSPGLFYHKGCMKCVDCSRVPDDENPLTMAPRPSKSVFDSEILEPLCQFCFAKKFKMSAIKIQEMVTIAPELDMSLGL